MSVFVMYLYLKLSLSLFNEIQILKSWILRPVGKEDIILSQFVLKLFFTLFPPLYCRAGSLNLGTIDICGSLIPCCGAVLRISFSRILCLYPLDTNSIPTSIVTTQTMSRHCQMPIGEKIDPD